MSLLSSEFTQVGVRTRFATFFWRVALLQPYSTLVGVNWANVFTARINDKLPVSHNWQNFKLTNAFPLRWSLKLMNNAATSKTDSSRSDPSETVPKHQQLENCFCVRSLILHPPQYRITSNPFLTMLDTLNDFLFYSWLMSISVHIHAKKSFLYASFRTNKPAP